ncbi:MAG: hypothetical protein O7B99_10730 [Planctomycetota bacterium]|nr:hypothetical protein [Planctomycetota bacterium]
MAARRRYSTRRRGQPEEDDDAPRRQPPSRRLPPGAYAAGVLAITGAVVLYIVIQMQPRQDSEAAETTEVIDPFEGLARDEPPPPRKGSRRPKRPRAESMSDDPFAGLKNSIRTDPIWIAAVEEAERGMELSDEAAKAKAEGDFSLFKERGKEAKELLKAAVDATRDWELEIGKQHGYDDVDVRRVLRVRKRWMDELVALKKTVGL